MLDLIKPYNRKIVLFIDDETRYEYENDHNKKWFDLFNNKEKAITILNLDEADQFIKMFEIQGAEKTISNNTSYILNPYNSDSYFLSAKAKINNTINLHYKTIELSRLLGAKRVMIESRYLLDTSSRTKLDIDGNYKVGKGKFGLSMTELNSLKNSIKLDEKLTGGKSNFSLAHKFLLQNGLLDDPFFNHILSVRNPNDSNNILNEFSSEICTTSSLKSTLDIIASLKLPGIGIGANFNQVKSKSEEIFLKYKIIF